jgi:hypothetical protein
MISPSMELGAYLFGQSVFMTLGYGLSAFGNFSKEGMIYEKSMSGLMFSDKFNQELYDTSLNTFKKGSLANNGSSGKIYDKFKIIPNDKNPLIKRLFPLVR